jgi:hypothetical protein
VVGDSGGLLATELGSLIDRHDAVLRFNLAPTAGHQAHVGHKTTFRMLNPRTARALARGGAGGHQHAHASTFNIDVRHCESVAKLITN